MFGEMSGFVRPLVLSFEGLVTDFMRENLHQVKKVRKGTCVVLSMGYLNWEIFGRFLVGLMVIYTAPIGLGYTDPRDVYAVNNLYIALGSPPLPGWLPENGDPCMDAWQGVECVFSNITAIKLNGKNLGGQLGNSLDYFSSIITIDLSDNHIGGSIPANLPLTIRNFFLSANQLTGNIPATLSSFSLLSDVSLSNNHLTGAIPDAFQQLTGLINLDLSGNSFSGQLPPSVGSLTSLSSLHLQNNQLSGTLDVLQDLHLIDLNIENNLFSGPIPEKVLHIPSFRKGGNPFNTTILPSPPALTPLSSMSGAPSSEEVPDEHEHGPSATGTHNSGRKGRFLTLKSVIWIAIGGVLLFVVIALGCSFTLRYCKGKHAAEKFAKRHDMGAYNASNETLKYSQTLLNNQIDHGTDSSSKLQDDEEMNGKRMAALRSPEEHKMDMTGMDVNLKHPPPPLPPSVLLPAEQVIASSRVLAEMGTKRHFTENPNPQSSLRSFTVALLQQYTNSFSQANLVGTGTVGSVYRAEISGGTLLAVKKLDTTDSRFQSDDDFLELVSSISKLHHLNIVELIGYCVEHGQRLLVYEYCRNGTLYDALHLDDEIHKKLSWNVRIQIALGAARTLEYLHEVCNPPIVHQNFKSANILLDDKLGVHVSDCGLAPLLSSGSGKQLSGQLLCTYGYAAPEFELGSYTVKSDIYSFGVVMLELLTGRKSFDRSWPRGEQYLVRWAITQLHDIDLLSRMVDPYLKGAYPSKSLSRFADIISRCVQSEPEFRPPMSEIVQDLVYMIQREAQQRNYLGWIEPTQF